MVWASLVACVVLGILVPPSICTPQQHVQQRDVPWGSGGKVQVGYFTNWGIYGRNFQPADMDTSLLTHVLYSFADIDPQSGMIKLSDTYADTDKHFPGDSWTTPGNNLYGCFAQLYKLKLKQRNLKVLLSVGGWSYSQAGHFNFVSNETAREIFVASAVTMIENYGLDGIDIDFEFPTTVQKLCFSMLLKELRAALDVHATTKGDATSYVLTAAVSAGVQEYVDYDLAGMDASLSFFNLMAYDYAGSWSPLTEDLANLYGGEVSGVSTDAAIQYYLQNGATASKIAIGLPIYGRAFEATKGIYQPYSGVGPGTWEAGVYDYKALPLAGAKVTENMTSVTAYSYDSVKQELVSYDTPKIASAKGQYIVAHGLAGGMYWELSADKLGADSIVGSVGSIVGKLDSTPNHINYPGSLYDNIRNNMKSTSRSASASSSSQSGPATSASAARMSAAPASFMTPSDAIPAPASSATPSNTISAPTAAAECLTLAESAKGEVICTPPQGNKTQPSDSEQALPMSLEGDLVQWAATARPTARSTTCAEVPHWTAERAFSAGERATHAGQQYVAMWWNEAEPGPASAPWYRVGAC